jgi:SNF2 family DNA or RNA helicase
VLYNPWLYQREAIQWIIQNKFSGLFLDPGLGKTSITLAAIRHLKDTKQFHGALIIAPLRVVQLTWPAEMQKWDNFHELTHTTLHKAKGKATLWGPRKDIYLINPEGLPWLYDELLAALRKGRKPPFRALWVDESTKFKSPTAVTRFKLLKDMLPLFDRRHIMTGTPAPRGLLDLWAQIYLLDEGKALEDSYEHYQNKYFAKDYGGFSYTIKDGGEKRVHKHIAPLVLEMSAADHLEMPELVFNNIPVKLDDKTQKAYDAMEQEFFIELEQGGEVSAQQSAHASMKCHQIANGKCYVDWPVDEMGNPIREGKREVVHFHKKKIEALKDLVDELAGKPLLVAYCYKHDLLALQEAFGKDVPYIGSGVTLKQAKELEREWNAGNLPIMLGQPASMGHGLNFQQSGNDICWYSLTWNLEHYLQFNARVWRQGVKGKMVRCHHIVAENTVDLAMLTRLGERAAEQNDLRTSLRAYRLQKLLHNRK